MELIKQFFQNINRSDIDETMQHLVTEGLIDSIDIMALVSEIEKHYQKTLDADYINVENFESMESIKNMLNKAMG